MDYILNKLEEFAAANNADPVDHVVVTGNDVGLIFRSFQTTAGWHSPANAKVTVPGGKKLVVLRVVPDNALQRDTGYRFARLQNVTDNVTVVTQVQFQHCGLVDRDADSLAGSLFPEVASGKTVELQLFNSSGPAASRRAGAMVVAKFVNA